MDGEDGFGLGLTPRGKKSLSRTLVGPGSAGPRVAPASTMASADVRGRTGAGAMAGVGGCPGPGPAGSRTAARSRKVRRCSGPDESELENAVQLINNGDGWRRPRPSTTLVSARGSTARPARAAAAQFPASVAYPSRGAG